MDAIRRKIFDFGLLPFLSDWDRASFGQCPDCRAKKALSVYATGGLSINVICSQCGAKFWISPVKEAGIQRIDGGRLSDV